MVQPSSTGTAACSLLQALVGFACVCAASLLPISVIVHEYGSKNVVVTQKYSVSIEEYKKSCFSDKETAESSAKCVSNAHPIYEVRTDDGHYFDLTKRELSQVRKGDHLVFKHRQLVSINGHAVKNTETSNAG